MKPKVSISIAVYNTGKFVLEGLESLIHQDYPLSSIEVFAIDDCSKDNSFELISDWMSKHPELNLTLIRNSVNKGVCGTLNVGLKLSTGKYFMSMADDIWLPSKVSSSVGLLEVSSNDIAFIHSNYNICDENGIIIKERAHVQKKKVSDDPFIQILCLGLDIHAVTTTFRRSILIEAGGFNESLSFEDLDCYLTIFNKDLNCHYIDEVLVNYRKLNNRSSLSDEHASGSYKLVSDLHKISQNHVCEKNERKLVMQSLTIDCDAVMNINSKKLVKKALKNYSYTTATPFLIRKLKEERKFLQRTVLLTLIYFNRKNQPFNFRDILYLIKKYFH